MTEWNHNDHRPPKGFLKGINIRYFMDCYQEWHAFVQGWCEAIAFFIPPRLKILSPILAKEIVDEHHYYMFGRAMGVITWVGIALGIRAVVQ